ncbi:hypothetical protein WMF38_57585 [Sorangium sp. So ce118]
MSDDEQIKLLASINDILMSGLRIAGIQRSQLEFVQELGHASGWMVTPHRFYGESVDVVFSVDKNECPDPRKKVWQYNAA